MMSPLKLKISARTLKKGERVSRFEAGVIKITERIAQINAATIPMVLAVAEFIVFPPKKFLTQYFVLMFRISQTYIDCQ